jgi:D-aspartate ligase
VHIDAHGEPSPSVTVRKLRQKPPFIGGARVVEVIADIPELRDATIAMLRRAGFRGIAFAEFKRDPRSGRYVFIEVNGRAVLFNSVLPPTGIDLVACLWADVMDATPLRFERHARNPVWIHEADVIASLVHRQEERLPLRELVAPYRRPKTFAVWSIVDPKPFMAQMAMALRDVTTAIRRRGTFRSLRVRRGQDRPLA